MNFKQIFSFGIFLDSIALIAWCSSSDPASTRQADLTVEELTTTETLFNKKCASCHGDKVKRMHKSFTCLDQIHAPGHHTGQSLILTAKGVARAHHWNFSDMPGVSGTSDDELDLIIKYVGSNQQKAGIS